MTNKVKAKVWLPTKDWKKQEEKEIVVTVSEFNGRNDIIYSANIPNYIFDMLTSKKGDKLNYQKYKEAAQAMVDNRQESQLWLAKKKLEKDYLQKKVESPLISALIDELEDLGRAAAFIVQKEELDEKKKIFVRFNPVEKEKSCNWTGGYMGKLISSNFQFFIGYEVIESKNKLAFEKEKQEQVPRYYTYISRHTGSLAHLDTGGEEGLKREPLHMHDENSRQNFINSYHILDWTQERENFFLKVQEKFQNLNSELSIFLLDLSEDKVDQLILNGGFKLLKS